MKSGRSMVAILIMALVALGAFSGISAAQSREYTSSGEITSSALVYTGKTLFSGVIIATDGTHDVTVTCYDNTSAAGKKLLPTFVVAAAFRFGGATLENPIKAETGIYCAISGTGASVVVHRALY